MALKDLIVPKWKHSRADVRLAAIDMFCNDLNVIREIAEKDVSSAVRIAAVKKIDDEQVLSTIIDTEKDAEVLDAAKKQLESILKKIIATSSDSDTVLRALEKFDNEKVTAAYLCDHKCDLAIQQKLIQHIKSSQLLAKLTEHECASEIAETIVAQISERELLERIAQRASNKKVRAIAQEKIDNLFVDPAAQEREITGKLKLCCSGMDIQVSPRNVEQSSELLEISRNIWNKYDPQWQHPLVATYKIVENTLRERIARAQIQKTALETLESVCEKMETLLTCGHSDTVAEQFDLLEKQWRDVDRSILQDIITVSLDDRFRTACAKIHGLIKEHLGIQERNRRYREALELACVELEQFTEDTIAPDDRVWRRLIANWNSACSNLAPDESLQKRFVASEKKYQEKVDALVQMEKSAMQDEIERVEQLAAEMQSISQAGPQLIRSKYQQVVKIKQQWDKPWPLAKKRKAALQEEFISAYDSFMDTWYELREQSSWQQWASGNAKSKILEEIESLELQVNQGESLRKISRRIGLYDSQWKQASGFGKQGGSDLDERYSAVRERILAAALAKKAELLEHLKTVLAAPEQNATDEIKTLQKQWNEIGFLPAEMEMDLPETFYGLCNSYFEQRKEQYQKYTEDLDKNCKIREEICAEAARLVESTEWKSTREAFSGLQKRWDESWPAPHKRSQELWDQFSASRSAFFERYHAFQSENDKRKEALCDEAERLLARLTEWEAFEHEKPEIIIDDEPAATTDENGESIAVESESTTDSVPASDAGESEGVKINFGSILSAAIKLQKAWKESGPASAEHSDELWERFNGTVKKVFAIIDEEHRKNFELKEAIVKAAEALAVSEDWDVTSNRFQELRAQWKTIRPAAYRDDQALWKRLQAAGDTFFGRRRAYFDNQKSVVKEKLEEKEAIITELEIIVRIAGKSHLLKTSQTQSAAEVLKKGIDLRNQLIIDGDPEKTYNNIKKRAFEIIDIWESGEQPRGKEFYQLERRFDELLDILRRR